MVVIYGRFEKPGSYRVTFRYSTAEDDLRQWLVSWGGARVPGFISDWIRNVPKLKLSCSILIEVTD